MENFNSESSRSVDFESQRLIDELNAEEENRRFDKTETNKKRSFVVDVKDDDGEDIVSANKKQKTKSDEAEGEGNDDKGTSSEPKESKQHSDVWPHYTVVSKVDKSGKAVKKAVCKHCKTEYSHHSHKNGTTTLRRHLEKCKLMVRNGDVGKMIINAEAKLQARKIDHLVFREMVAKCIIQHDLPYAYVEYERVRSVWKYLNADVKFFSRNTAAADVYKFYENETAKLKRELAQLPGRICFTSDLWTAITHQGYMCLTAHYVDTTWKLQNKILVFCAFPPPHTGMHLAMELLEKFKDWGIEKKVFSMTLDNATSNDSMQDILKSQLVLRDDLLCGGEFFHVRCSAHILNLIVQDGLKVIGDCLIKIRESIKYVGASESREILFAKCVERVGIKSEAGLILDVTTRWNSTYHMLKRAIAYRPAFVNLKIIDAKNYKFLPTEDEWIVGKMICDFLKPFDEITRLISGSAYPTSNLYFMQVWNIQIWLKDHAVHRNETIKEMVKVMQQKFDKYWEEYSDILAMATVFDPRLKFTLAEYCFSKLDVETCEERLKHLRGKLTTLFETYESKFKSVSLSSKVRETAPQKQADEREEESGNLANYNDFFAFRKSNVAVSGKSSLVLYLEEPPMDPAALKSLDVLTYWKDNCHRFRDLAAMACDILSIPITTVASESSFSIGSRVLNKYRSRLLPKNVQALICSRNWLKGFEAYENEEDETFDDEDETLPSFQSIVDGDE